MLGVPTPFARWHPLHDVVAIHGLHRQREWDVVAAASAPGLDATDVDFVVLADGTILTEDDAADLSPLAEALEEHLRPPYRAHAVHKEGKLWAVGARAIDVLELEQDVRAEEVDVAVIGRRRTVVVDRELSSVAVPELERLGHERGYGDFVVHARHLDGPLWEVKVSPL